MNQDNIDQNLSLDEIHPRPVDVAPEIEQPALAPADEGKAAWLMLVSACLIQLPVWGL